MCEVGGICLALCLAPQIFQDVVLLKNLCNWRWRGTDRTDERVSEDSVTALGVPKYYTVHCMTLVLWNCWFLIILLVDCRLHRPAVKFLNIDSNNLCVIRFKRVQLTLMQILYVSMLAETNWKLYFQAALWPTQLRTVFTAAQPLRPTSSVAFRALTRTCCSSYSARYLLSRLLMN